MSRAARGSGQRSPSAPDTALVVGNYIASLAVVRSLAAAGYRVIAGDGGEYAPVRHSRHCHEVWAHPPIREGEDFLAALTALLERRPEISVVLPLRPVYVEFLAAHRQRLPTPPVVASPDPEVVLTCLDKERMYGIAAEVGVPHHPVRRAHDLAELARVCEEVGFPCVIRPISDTGQGLPGDRKALICPDRGALEGAYGVQPTGGPPLLVQRFAPGLRHNVFFAARRGAILAQFQARILRTDRVDGTGLAVQGVTVPADPRLTAHSQALVDRLGYTGIGFVQFLVPEQGPPHFLELNPRHAGSTAIADHCGLDLTMAAIALASGRDPEVDGDAGYPVGRRYAWTSRELYSLGMALTRAEIGRGAVAPWLASIIRAAIRADVHLTWSLRDPLPTLAVYAHLASLAPWRRRLRAESQRGSAA